MFCNIKLKRMMMVCLELLMFKVFMSDQQHCGQILMKNG